MKFKKCLLIAVAVLGLATSTGFNHQLVKADTTNTTPAQTTTPDKNKVVSQILLSFLKKGGLNNGSGHLYFLLQIKPNKNKHKQFTFKDSSDFNLKSSVTHDCFTLDKDKIQFWSKGRKNYMKEGKKWYKFSFPKDDRQAISQIQKDNAAEQAFEAKIYNAVQVTDDGSNYILTLANDPKLNAHLWRDIIKAEKLHKSDLDGITELKVDNFTVRSAYDKTTYGLVNGRLDLDTHHKKEVFNLVIIVDHMNEYQNLRIPCQIVKHAKKMK